MGCDFNIPKLDLGVPTNLSRCFFWRSKAGRFPSSTLLKGKQRIRLAAHNSFPLGKSRTHLLQVDSFYVAKLCEQVLGPVVCGGAHTFLPTLIHSLTADRSVTMAS